jgi:hypothetical protein
LSGALSNNLLATLSQLLSKIPITKAAPQKPEEILFWSEIF